MDVHVVWVRLLFTVELKVVHSNNPTFISDEDVESGPASQL